MNAAIKTINKIKKMIPFSGHPFNTFKTEKLSNIGSTYRE